MATTPEFIVYDGQPTNPSGLTPFAFYDAESPFQLDAPKVADMVATRLGYPIMDVELQDKQIYACFEEAITEYGKQVNQFRLRDDMYSLLGSATSNNLTGKNIVSTPLNQVIKLSKNYGTEALSGGDVELKKGYVRVSAGTQSYDLKATWADVSESGNAIEIRKIYHHLSPAVSRYYDPFATTGLGLTNLMAEFGFSGMSPAVSFVMMPAYEDMLRIQAIEINDQIRKSLYTFTVADNIVRFSPLFSANDIVWFDYYVVDEKSISTQSGSANQYISDISNAPLDNLAYTDINSVGRMWIYKYTLALAKEVLGIIRSKYEHIPIPNAEIRMDGELLRKEAVDEKKELITELQETLEKSGKYEQMKMQAEIIESQNTILGKAPIPIYIF
jgi:hypothetical protein